MRDVTITGVSITSAKPSKAGHTIIAYFDCTANGLHLCGCALVRTPRRGLTVWPPKVEAPKAPRRAVSIVSDDLRSAMLQAARDAYRAIGGTEAEWEPNRQMEA